MEHTFDEDYWNQVWTSDRAPSMSAGRTNPHLVEEVGDLAPGTALEAGCGAGTEALWLARQGWQVTATDIAAAPLAIAAERAAAAGLTDRVRWVRADLSSWDPGARFDLVVTHYAHPAMPQLDFYDVLSSWVAPGGTLLVVGHLHHRGDEHDHRQGHGHEHDGPPDVASVTAAAITARLDAGSWAVRTARETQRTVTGPGGRATVLHDVVVRADRR